jgi:hypothetical protein
MKYTYFTEWNIIQNDPPSSQVTFRMPSTCFFALEYNIHYEKKMNVVLKRKCYRREIL